MSGIRFMSVFGSKFVIQQMADVLGTGGGSPENDERPLDDLMAEADVIENNLGVQGSCATIAQGPATRSADDGATTDKPPADLLGAALWYARHGWPVLPTMPCGSIKDGKPSKVPIGYLAPHGVKDATTDVAVIRRWWTARPDANIGICGANAATPFFIIDVDVHDGEDGFANLAAAGFELPKTLQAKTPRGGNHYFCKWTRGDRPRQTQSNIRDMNNNQIKGVDVRGVNGYVLVYPSRTTLGRYEWCNTRFDDLAEYPEWAKRVGSQKAKRATNAEGPVLPNAGSATNAPLFDESVRKNSRRIKGADKTARVQTFLNGSTATADAQALKRATAYLAKVPAAIEGQGGHGALLHAAETLVIGFGLSDADALGLLWNEYNPRCVPPWNRGDESERREFERKVSEARRVSTNAVGYLLNKPLDAHGDAADGEELAADIPRFGDPLDEANDGSKPPPIVKGKVRLLSFKTVEITATARGGTSLCRAIETALAQARSGSCTGEGAGRHETFDMKKDAAPVTHLAVALWMRSRGRFFYNAKTRARKDTYFFDNVEGRLVGIASDEFSSWLANETRIIREDKAFKRLLSFLQDAAMPCYVSAGVKPSEYFAKKGDALYISNGESRMVRCRGGRAELVRNGTDDVLFYADKSLKPWTLGERGAGIDPFEHLEVFANATYTTTYGRELLRAWYLNLFACHDTLPPMLLTGERGSGKTKLAKGIMELLGVPVRIVGIDKKREDDFAVMVDTGGVLCLDNIEEEIVKAEWFESAIERAATEGTMETTEKYTHNLHKYEVRANLIISSKHPIFAKNDGLTDRLIIIRLDVRDETKDAQLFDEIKTKRDACMTWTAWTLADALAADIPADAKTNLRHPDFGAFALKAAKACGRFDAVLGALTAGEFDKTLLTMQTNLIAREILDAVLAHDAGHWEATATEIARFILQRDGVGEITDSEQREQTKLVGVTLKRLAVSFRICFPHYRTATRRGTLYHVFQGANPRLTARPEEADETAESEN